MDLSKEKQLMHTLVQNNVITNLQASQCLNILAQSGQVGQQTLVSILVAKRYVTLQQLTPFLQSFQAANSQTSPGAQTGGGAQGSSKLQIGQYFQHYQIQKELGRGGMGAVYKAYDSKLNREVALKVILAGDHVGERQIGRFMLEAKSMAQFRHSNIVEVYEVGETPQNYFTMEYIEGISIAQWTRKDSYKVMPVKIAGIVKQCAQALEEVHKYKIVHRDIKPANIMLASENCPKLMDFGLAKVFDSNLSQTGEILGTPAYMSPEQINAEDVGLRSDIYALGATLYEMLTQRPPFQGSTFVNIASQINNNDPIAPRLLDPDIPVDLEAITLKCLEKDQAKRYKSAKLLAQDLHNFLGNRPINAKHVTKFTHLKKWLLRNKTLVIVCTLMILIIAISMAFVMISLQKQAQVEKLSASKARSAEEKAHKAKIEALKAQKIAFKERDKAVIASKKLETAYKTLELEKKETEKQRDKAHKAQKEAIASLYYMHITLAQKYCEEGKISAAWRILRLYKENVPGWEWHWLYNRINQQISTLVNASGAVHSFSITSNNKNLVSIDAHNCTIWDLAKKKIIHKFKITPDSFSCAVSPDGTRIASLSRNGHLDIWNRKGKKIRTLTHINRGKHVVFHPNGKIVLCCYNARDEGNYAVKKRKNTSEEYENLILWDITTGKKALAIHAHKSPFANDVYYCNFNRSGKLIVTAGEDKTVRVYSSKSGKEIRVLKGHKSEVKSCSFSPDGKKILSANYDSISLWDIKSAKLLKRFDKGIRKVIRCFFSPNGRYIISGNAYGVLRLWDTLSGKEIRAFYGHVSFISNCKFLADSNTIVSASHDGTIRFFKVNMATNPFMLEKKRLIYSCSISPDGKTIAPIIEATFKLELYDTIGRKISPKPIALPGISHSAFSPDGKNMVIATGVNYLRVYNVKNQTQIIEYVGIRSILTVCTYSKDGSKIITGGDSNILQIWDAETTPKATDKFRRGVFGNKVKIIQRSSQMRFKGHKSRVYQVALSPKGDYLLGATRDDQTLYIWETTQKSKRAKNPLHKIVGKGVVRCCTYNNDGSKIIFGNGKELTMIDAKTRKKLAIFANHEDTIRCCLFTPDGKRIITAAYDGSIKIWESNAIGKIQDGVRHINSPLLTLMGHKSPIVYMTLSLNGKKLVSGDDQGIIQIWNIDK